jgi:hypothetical protein
LFHLLLFAFILFSCQQREKKEPDELTTTPPPNTSLYEITLMDSLGKMSIYLPEEYDTSFFWTYYSDCGPPCDKIMYRFQSKKLAIDPESGDFHHYVPSDSINRFTMHHSGGIRYDDGNDSVQIHVFHPFKLDYFERCEYGSAAVEYDRIEFISDRYFSIFYINLDRPDSASYCRIVKSICSLRGNGVEFEFLLYSKHPIENSQSFYDYCTQILRTCRFERSK